MRIKNISDAKIPAIKNEKGNKKMRSFQTRALGNLQEGNSK